MAACSLVNDSRHLQADCQAPGSAPEPFARQSSMGYLYLFYDDDDAYVKFFQDFVYQKLFKLVHF